MDRDNSLLVENNINNVESAFVILKKGKRNLFFIAMFVGIISLISTLFLKATYKSTAIIMPVIEGEKQVSPLGALASIGVLVGGNTKLEDLESVFNSEDLSIRVVKKYNLWSIILGDNYNADNNIVKVGVLDRILENESRTRHPNDWDAIRAVRKQRIIQLNKKAGTLSISYISFSPESSSNIVKYYLEEGKSRLQEEALDRASNNKRFIQDQLSKTIDPLIRERLFVLLGQEIEKEMLAHNRNQFGFRIIDTPKIPDRKYGPHRIWIFFISVLITVIIIIPGYIIYSNKYLKSF